MTSADQKQFVTYGFIGAASAALYRFAPAVFQGLVHWLDFIFQIVTIGPFLSVLYCLYFFAGGSDGNHAARSFVECLSCLSAFLFWCWVLPRLFCRWGIRNPFRRLHHARPLSFRAFVALSDWWNKTLHFGRHKTGGWAGLIEALASPYRHGDLFLGRVRLFTNGGLLRSVGIATEKHMVTIAEPGAGKSTGAAIPNICVHPGALLAIDPKGELATICASRRGQGGNGVQGLGQAVKIVDPYSIVKNADRASYNPFDELAAVEKDYPGRAISYSGRIAEALIKPSANEENSWCNNAARILERGLVLHVHTGPAEKRNLRYLRRLIMEGDIELHREKLAAGEITDKGRDAKTPFDVLLQAMIDAPPGPYRDVIAGSASSINLMGDRQRGCVVTTAQEETSFLDLPEIIDTTDRSDFLLQDFKTKKLSVFLCLPINELKGDAGRWLRLFVLLFIDMMMLKQEAPKEPVLLLIDEFPNLGRLDGIEVVAPVMRSYGVRLWVIGQDIGQFQAVYPKTWEGFIGCAQAVQFMAVKHPETVAYIVKLLGEKIVKTRSPDGRLSERPVPLLDAEQVSRFLEASGKNQIIWRGDKRPLRLKVAHYFSYLPLFMYSPDPRFKEGRIKSWLRSRAVRTPARQKASGSSAWAWAWASVLRSAGLWMLLIELFLFGGCGWHAAQNDGLNMPDHSTPLVEAVKQHDMKEAHRIAEMARSGADDKEVDYALKVAIDRNDAEMADMLFSFTYQFPFMRYAAQHGRMRICDTFVRHRTTWIINGRRVPREKGSYEKERAEFCTE